MRMLNLFPINWPDLIFGNQLRGFQGLIYKEREMRILRLVVCVINSISHQSHLNALV